MKPLSALTICISLLAAGLVPAPAAALDVAGAGSDLQSEYESDRRQVLMDVYNVPQQAAWRVDVRRVDSTWHPDLGLYIRRTNKGTGGGAISGGSAYQEVGTTNSQFVYGDKQANNVAIQLRLTGMSVSVPPGTYSTTVVYTVVDTGG